MVTLRLTHLLVPLLILVVGVNSSHHSKLGHRSRTCRLCGDPHFHGWMRPMKCNAPWPCIFRLAKTQRFHLGPNTTAEVEIRTRSGLQTLKGRYVIDCVIIFIWIFDYWTGQLLGLLIYQIYVIDFTTSPWQPWQLPVLHDAITQLVYVSSDSGKGEASLKIMRENGFGYHVAVEFSIPAGGRKHRCLKVEFSYDVQPPDPEALFPYTLCSTFQDRHWGNASHEVDISGSSNQEILLYGLLRQTVAQTEPVCMYAMAAADLCASYADLFNAVKVCDYFLEKLVVQCLDMGPGGNIGDAVRAFYGCIIMQCTGVITPEFLNLLSRGC